MFHIPRASQVLYKEPATSCSWRVCVSRVTGKQDIRYSSILFDGDRRCFATAQSSSRFFDTSEGKMVHGSETTLRIAARRRQIINFSMEKAATTRETKVELARREYRGSGRGFVCGRRHDTRYPSFERRAGIKTDSSFSALRMSS